MSILIFFIILLLLVLVHEFGHFIVAKKSGIRVDEFGFGFPPRLFGKKYGETEYTINALPFGGFVKIFGEEPNEASTTGPDAGRSMINKPRYIQAAVLFAGVFFNFLLAWILISLGFVSGLPTSGDFDPNLTYAKAPALTLTSIVKDSPAHAVGLMAGDTIHSVDGIKDPSIETFQNVVAVHAGEDVHINYERNGVLNSLTVVPKEGVADGHAGIGVSIDMVGIVKLPLYKALAQGFRTTAVITRDTAVSLAMLVHDSIAGHADLSSLTGPVGLVGVVGDAYRFGFVHLVMLTALISINLAIINLVPFPALDGGRLLFLLIEKIKGSRISSKFANIANSVGFFILIGLMLVVTYHDIIRLIK